MIYLRNDIRITKEQAYDHIRFTAKYAFNENYTDNKIDGMFRDPKYNSFTCIDEASGEQFVVYGQDEKYKAPERLVQGRLF